MRLSNQTIGGRLSSRLIITFVTIILITTIAAGTLAYWLTHTELEKQAWARLKDGQRVTLTLIGADRQSLDNLVTLTAQRPTLQKLLRDEDMTSLEDYINQFQSGTNLDALAIYDTNGQILTGINEAVICGLPLRQQTADFCLFPGPPPQLALLGGQPIMDSTSGELLGHVMMAIIIDNAYELERAAETGMEQSILVDGSRIASSLSQEGALGGSTTTQATAAPAALTDAFTLAGEEYITILFPLSQVDGDILALAEVALPVTGLKATERRIMITLIASTLFIAAAGSISALVLRKNINDEALEHLRSHFLANITHEFRTPLSALRASVEFLVDEMANLSREEINELLHAIHMSVTRLQTLVDNLLESISIEAGHFVIRPEPMEISDVVDEAERIMQPLLNRRRQQLEVSYMGTPPLVNGDPMRLTQVLVNLLANASKYGPMGQTIDLTVELIAGGAVRTAVADRGPGLSPAMREKVFKRFARFSTANDPQHGVGLGLWVVKVIVTEHGGTVGVDDRPGGGAIFWFTLPPAAL